MENDAEELLIVSLTPSRLGAEMVVVDEVRGATALVGTGFNPDSRQHTHGSDALRYAIALQQMREDGDFARLDAARSRVERFGYFVMQGRDGTTVKSMPWGFDSLTEKERKQFRIDSYVMRIDDGIIYDTGFSLHSGFYPSRDRRDLC